MMELKQEIIDVIESFVSWDGVAWRINSDHPNDSDMREIWDTEITDAKALLEKLTKDKYGN